MQRSQRQPKTHRHFGETLRRFLSEALICGLSLSEMKYQGRKLAADRPRISPVNVTNRTIAILSQPLSRVLAVHLLS